MIETGVVVWWCAAATLARNQAGESPERVPMEDHESRAALDGLEDVQQPTNQRQSVERHPPLP